MTSTPRRTPRLRPIHFVLSVLLALAGVVAIGAPAHAVADKIEGTVTTPAATAGINVYLSQELNTGTGPAFTGTPTPTTTDGTGYFSFTGIADAGPSATLAPLPGTCMASECYSREGRDRVEAGSG